jgi:5'-nucleotidase
MEAAIEGIPSIGFSLFDYKFDADFSIAAQVANELTKKMLGQPLPDHILLNVNIPIVTAATFKGLKICRQAYAKWDEQFDHRKDPRGRDYYWMVGKFVNRDTDSGTDVEALKDGYASIVPVTIDFTDRKTKEWLEKEWKF